MAGDLRIQRSLRCAQMVSTNAKRPSSFIMRAPRAEFCTLSIVHLTLYFRANPRVGGGGLIVIPPVVLHVPAVVLCQLALAGTQRAHVCTEAAYLSSVVQQLDSQAAS